jgi:hypothetical protein
MNKYDVVVASIDINSLPDFENIDQPVQELKRRTHKTDTHKTDTRRQHGGFTSYFFLKESKLVQSYLTKLYIYRISITIHDFLTVLSVTSVVSTSEFLASAMLLLRIVELKRMGMQWAPMV